MYLKFKYSFYPKTLDQNTIIMFSIKEFSDSKNSGLIRRILYSSVIQLISDLMRKLLISLPPNSSNNYVALYVLYLSQLFHQPIFYFTISYFISTFMQRVIL